MLRNISSSWAGPLLQIHFNAIPPASVDVLIEEGEVFWCAGGLMVEHPLVVPHVTKMEGGQDSVMGLSKETVMRLLCEAAAQ
jgi:septum formation protein